MSAYIAVVSPEPIAASDFGAECEIEQQSIVNIGLDADRLPSGATGLLIYAPNLHPVDCTLRGFLNEALDASIPILASGSGMHVLNEGLQGDAARSTAMHGADEEGEHVRRSIFLAPGAKISSTIGGSGWLTIGCDHREGISQAGLAPTAMASAISDDRVVEAFELPGHRWVIGVQWEVLGATRMPRGFDSVLMAFVERASGYQFHASS